MDRKASGKMASTTSFSGQAIYSYQILWKQVGIILYPSYITVYQESTYNIVSLFSWRCLYYIYSFIYGVVILWDKPWLWDIMHCYYNYPYHPVTNDLWWYYMVSMAFYWSLSFSQFFDVRRKDFWQMFIHHIATISLMCFSWISNLTRIGSLVLVVHDCADIFLEVRI